jgi:hypothetical protein
MVKQRGNRPFDVRAAELTAESVPADVEADVMYSDGHGADPVEVARAESPISSYEDAMEAYATAPPVDDPEPAEPEPEPEQAPADEPTVDEPPAGWGAMFEDDAATEDAVRTIGVGGAALQRLQKITDALLTAGVLTVPEHVVGAILDEYGARPTPDPEPEPQHNYQSFAPEPSVGDTLDRVASAWDRAVQSAFICASLHPHEARCTHDGDTFTLRLFNADGNEVVSLDGSRTGVLRATGCLNHPECADAVAEMTRAMGRMGGA